MKFSDIKKRAEDEWKELVQSKMPKIYIGAATCGRSAGALAVKQTFEEEIEKRGIDATLIESTEMIITVEGVTQIDLQINMSDTKYTLETRSSCVRKGTEFGITSGYFNILGWYNTSSKLGEPKKDFYCMYLFPFDSSLTMNEFEDGLVVHFVGGATKELLQGPLGSDETLKQFGAIYRGINPICAGLDAQKLVNTILK